MGDEPLSTEQKHAHVTLLIQAGADTSATALTATMQFIVTQPHILRRVHAEIESADKSGKLSTPIKFRESRAHLPYTAACIKESLRLNPPASFIFAREIPMGGKYIDGFFVPGGTGEF